MSKKDFEKAARIAQGYEVAYERAVAIDAFVELFHGEADGRFDENRFRRACVPGANVRARS
jgi:hypothetical protein